MRVCKLKTDMKLNLKGQLYVFTWKMAAHLNFLLKNMAYQRQESLYGLTSSTTNAGKTNKARLIMII